MKKIILITLFGFSTSAFAVPGNFVLTSPTKIIKKNGKIQVFYDAPCKTSEWASVVLAGDDSGDMEYAVGVAYPLSHCDSSSSAKEFSVMQDVSTSGVTFSKMTLNH